MKPVIQVALDFMDLERALKVAREAVAGGADWLEAGTPLIKCVGLDAVRALRREFPHQTIVADMKTMDAGRGEVEAAAKAGAHVVHVLGAASPETVKESIEAGKNYGVRIAVDLLEVADYVGLAKKCEKWGASHVSIHTPIDAQMTGAEPFPQLREVAKAVKIPIAVAGGINSETAPLAVKAGASIIIVGGAISKAENAKTATAAIKKAIATGKGLKTKLFKRGGEESIADILREVSCANISDAMHRAHSLEGLLPVYNGKKMVGRAVTVRSYPGDWAKPVEAIDVAQPGDVLVVDTGGVGPAVWGELATHSAVQRKLGGTIVWGGMRDIEVIRALKYPAFARLMMPNAGEPKGHGEINVPVTIAHQRIFPGDWIVGDQDGVMCIPQDKAVEIANRAMDVLEKENRLRKEIVEEGSTLGKVAYLLRWEKAK